MQTKVTRLHSCGYICFFNWFLFLNPEGGTQKSTLVVLVVVISSLRVQKSLSLSSYAAERNELCIHIRAEVAHRFTVSDFSLFSNY